MDDDTLLSLLASTAPRSILLLEDLDATPSPAAAHPSNGSNSNTSFNGSNSNAFNGSNSNASNGSNVINGFNVINSSNDPNGSNSAGGARGGAPPGGQSRLVQCPRVSVDP
ncbi:hypothetical protein T484DRAFT_1742891 [Baffinella frigidus]|nr:hypothetical protein T484DRAFT_1742891 [Cryptophyta sp. CCMP2293]